MRLTTYELRPAKDVALRDGRFQSLSDEPWLRIDGEFPQSRFVEIVYRASLLDDPVRPLLRFVAADGVVDRVLPGPVAGAGLWRGALPRGVRDVLISPAARPGPFAFAIERIRPVSLRETLARLWRRTPERLWSYLLPKLIGLHADADDALDWSINWEPVEAFDGWLAERARPFEREGLDAPRGDGTGAPTIAILLQSEDAASDDWSRTIASVERQLYDGVRLIVAARGESLAPRLAGADFLARLRPGDELADHALACVAEAVAREPNARLVYADEIIRARDGSQPGFKPSWSPLLEAARPYLGRCAFFALASLDLAAARDLTTLEAELRAAPFRLAGREIVHLRRWLLSRGEEKEPAHRRSDKGVRQKKSPLPHPDEEPPQAASRRMVGGGPSFETPASRAPQDEGDRTFPDRRPYPSAYAEPTAPSLGGRAAPTRPLSAGVAATPPRVSIIVPTRDRPDLLGPCLESVLRLSTHPAFELIVVDNGSRRAATHALLAAAAKDSRLRVIRRPGPFDFATINNEAAGLATGEVLVFLNNDTVVLSPDWLERLARHALEPEAGAIGALLLFPDGRIQHAGVVVGLGEDAGHFDALASPDAPSWLDRARHARETSAVTAACMAVDRRKFETVGGFDAAHLPIELNDIDLCLRLGERGWTSRYVPEARLIHHESASRGSSRFRPLRVYAKERAYFRERWRHAIRDDPYFHPALSIYARRPALW